MPKPEEDPNKKKESIDQQAPAQTSQEDLAEMGAQFRIKKALGTISESTTVGVSDVSGKKIFSGTPDQLQIFLKNRDYGEPGNIATIDGPDGKAIVRFGPGDQHDFLDRNRINVVLEGLQTTLAQGRGRVEDRAKAQEILRSVNPQHQSVESIASYEIEEGRWDTELRKDIRNAFAGIAEGINAGAMAKVGEYDQRMRAVLAGKPLRKGDTREQLAEDFRTITKQDWSPRFDFEKYRAAIDQRLQSTPEAPTLTAAEQAQLDQQIRETMKGFLSGSSMKREGVWNDAFIVSNGMLPDGTKFEKIDGAIGRDFDAHGIAKTDQLDKLLALLNNGIDRSKPFFTAPFEIPDEERAAMGSAMGTSGGTAYKEGLAIVTSGYRESLTEGGIKHVFVNDVFRGLKDVLTKRFPQYQFHLLSEQKKVLEDEARSRGVQ